MNRILRALLASLFSTVDAIRDHINGDGASDNANPVPAHNGGMAASGTIVHDTDDADTEPKPRKARRGRQRGRRSTVTYRIVKGANKGGKLAKMLDSERTTLQPVELDVLAAIQKAGTMTAFALEGVTGHGKKSIESAVWRLRKRHGMIESVTA